MPPLGDGELLRVLRAHCACTEGSCSETCESCNFLDPELPCLADPVAEPDE